MATGTSHTACAPTVNIHTMFVAYVFLNVIGFEHINNFGVAALAQKVHFIKSRVINSPRNITACFAYFKLTPSLGFYKQAYFCFNYGKIAVFKSLDTMRCINIMGRYAAQMFNKSFHIFVFRSAQWVTARALFLFKCTIKTSYKQQSGITLDTSFFPRNFWMYPGFAFLAINNRATSHQRATNERPTSGQQRVTEKETKAFKNRWFECATTVQQPCNNRPKNIEDKPNKKGMFRGGSRPMILNIPLILYNALLATNHCNFFKNSTSN